MVQANSLNLATLSEGAEKCLENAERLFKDARTLAGNGSYSTAVFLYQSSIEECAKIDLIGRWATSLLGGAAIDAAKLKKSLSAHRSKNNANAYDLKPTQAELLARSAGNWDAARSEFAKTQLDFHDESMRLRNAALYVDFRDGTFVAPQDIVPSATAAALEKFNMEHIHAKRGMVALLKRWLDNPAHGHDEITNFLTDFKEALEASPGDLFKAYETAISKARALVAPRVAVKQKSQS